MRGGPVVAGLPDEQELALYRGGLLRLTDRRIVYTGQGLRRNESMSMHLEDVTSVGMGWRVGFEPRFFAVPGFLVVIGLAFSLAIGWDDPFWFFLAWALGLAPLTFVMPTRAIRVTASGAKMSARVPRRLIQEAAHFVEHIERARAEARQPRRFVEAPMPTARPYGV